MTMRDDAAEYEVATREFLDAVTAVNQDNLDRRIVGGWTARQVIHHIADSEAQSYARLRRLIAEPEGSLIQGYDEAAWANCAALGYEDLPIDHSLAVFESARQSSLDVLGRLTDSDLTRYGVHSASGRYTLAFWITTYCEHPREHAAQLIEAINA